MLTLVLGDCIDKMKDIPDQSVDMCLTDPPYGTTACKWDNVIPFEPMWKELKRVVKPNGAICLFGSEPFSSRLRMSNLKMFKYDWVWEKEQGLGLACAKVKPLNKIEVISVFGFGKINYFPKMKQREKKLKIVSSFPKASDTLPVGKTFKKYERVSNETYPTNLVYFCRDRKRGIRGLHPTQKPVALLEYLIKTYTLEGDTVLDFTMGSGSTGVACKNLNRNFIGIELDEKYFEIAKKRIFEDQQRLAC